MVKINELIEIMKKTEFVPMEDEDKFAYFDKENNSFELFDTNELKRMEYGYLNGDQYEKHNVLSRLEEITKDETGRYIYLKNPYTKTKLTYSFIELFKKNKELYSKMNKAFGGKNKFVKLKGILYENKMLNKYNEFIENNLKDASIKWCVKNNIEYEL